MVWQQASLATTWTPSTVSVGVGPHVLHHSEFTPLKSSPDVCFPSLISCAPSFDCDSHVQHCNKHAHASWMVWHCIEGFYSGWTVLERQRVPCTCFASSGYQCRDVMSSRTLFCAHCCLLRNALGRLTTAPGWLGTA